MESILVPVHCVLLTQARGPLKLKKRLVSKGTSTPTRPFLPQTEIVHVRVIIARQHATRKDSVSGHPAQVFECILECKIDWGRVGLRGHGKVRCVGVLVLHGCRV